MGRKKKGKTRNRVKGKKNRGGSFNGDTCVVEALVDHRSVLSWTRRSYLLEYYVKWDGYGPEDNLWIPEHELNCPLLVLEYWKNIDIPEFQFRTIVNEFVDDCFDWRIHNFKDYVDKLQLRRKLPSIFPSLLRFALPGEEWDREYMDAKVLLDTMYDGKVRIENTVDNTLPPLGFEKSVIGIVKQEDAACYCNSNCNENCPCYREINDPNNLWTCNSRCKCQNCANRIIPEASVCITRTGNRTWTLVADKLIQKGQVVCEHIGEVISTRKAKTKANQFGHAVSLKALRLFQEVYEFPSGPIAGAIDQSRYFGPSRFIQHSCTPNVSIVYVFTRDNVIPRLFYVALEDILVGEDIVVDYFPDVTHVATSEKLDRLHSEETDHLRCQCDEPNCRRLLYHS